MLQTLKPVSITKVKYLEWFPIIFYYDDGPNYYRFKGVQSLKEELKPGDILLRRYDNYLDGLILSQTSYYTHAAIYYGNNDGKEFQVIHAVGEGVEFVDIESFAKCDSIAVLRFEFNSAILPDKIPPFVVPTNSSKARSIDIKDTVIESDKLIPNIRFFIERDQNSDDSKKKDIADKELPIYDDLVNNIHSQSPITPLQEEICIPLILDFAKISKGKGYDYLFNFKDSEKFSCVELVWHCYKFLYPLHQVAREGFNYFKWVETLVIVPDLFLKSEFFKLVYIDGKEITNHKNEKIQLITDIKEKYFNFWLFMLRIVSIQLILLALIYGLLEIFSFILNVLNIS
jgi:hypothetical protein